MSGKVYIYNKNQKDFYIKEGCRLLDADIHKVPRKFSGDLIMMKFKMRLRNGVLESIDFSHDSDYDKKMS